MPPVTRIEIHSTCNSQSQQRLVEDRLSHGASSGQYGNLGEWDIRTNEVYWSPECFTIMGTDQLERKLQSFQSLVVPQTSRD